MKTKSIYIIIALFLLTGCVRETLDPCPEGQVRIQIYVEKFQADTGNPLDDPEPNFNDRIKNLHYYLYKENTLQEQGVLTDVQNTSDSSYLFQRSGLPFGDYRLLLIGNGGNEIIAGTPDHPDNLWIIYPGVDQTDDYFSASFPFTVDCNCTQHYRTGLMRTHGVIRYSFRDIPANVTAMEMSMSNITTKKQITGDYAETAEVTKRVALDTRNTDKDIVIGTFPTPGGQHSAYHLKIYTDHSAEPWYDKQVTDTLTVRRNQLLVITTRFTQSYPQFEVIVDPKWDGSIPGGDTELQ